MPSLFLSHGSPMIAIQDNPYTQFLKNLGQKWNPKAIKLSKELQRLFEKHGIAAHLDLNRGLDHGIWVLLKHMYPEANIPVVQISINPFLPPEEQYFIGSLLSEFAQDDYLILGSGATVHNLRLLNWEEQTETEPWAIAFDDWIIQQIFEENFEALFSYDQLAPYAKMAVPRPEHLVPLFLALGSSKINFSPQVLYRGYEMGSLSYLGLQFA
jgi:4,5-DOPA dioxygenase extradiol